MADECLSEVYLPNHILGTPLLSKFGFIKGYLLFFPSPVNGIALLLKMEKSNYKKKQKHNNINKFEIQ